MVEPLTNIFLLNFAMKIVCILKIDDIINNVKITTIKIRMHSTGFINIGNKHSVIITCWSILLKAEIFKQIIWWL